MIVGIDHVFASGAVVGRCARSDGRPHSCVVARPTTAPDAKTGSISIPPRSFRSQQSNREIFKQNYPQLNRYHQLQINATFLGEYVAMHARDDVTMVDKCKQSTTTSTTHENKNFLVNTFHGGLKAWMDLYRHNVCPGSYLNYAFSIFVAKLRQFNRGIPSRSWRYLICIITRELCSYNAWLLNDDVTAIEVSYWRRREFPNYARLLRGRIGYYAYSS